jgi:hypothetical protein
MEPLLKPKDVAELTHITETALSTLRYLGKGPKFLKPTPRVVLYRMSDVEAWLNASEQTITSS